MATHSVTSNPVGTSATSTRVPLRQSLGFKLFLFTGFGALMGLGAMVGFTWKNSTDAARSEIQTAVSRQVGAIESKLTPIQQHARAMATAVSAYKSQGIQDQKTYEDLAFGFFLSQPDIGYGLGFGQTPTSLLGDRDWFFPYYYYDQDTDAQIGGRLPAPYENVIYSEIAVDSGYNEEVYYTQPVETQQEVWLEPYGANGVLLMTYAAPIFDEAQNLLGITNVDITVSDLVAQLGEAGVVKGEGYFAVLSGEGNIITFPPNQPPAPEEGEAGSSFETDETLAKIWPSIARAAASEPAGLVSIPGSGNFWAYEKVASTEWVMLASVPVGTVVWPVALSSLGSAALAALVLGGAVWLFVRSLNQRLDPMLAECNKLAVTDASTLTQLRDRDEVGRLSVSFFNLLDRLRANQRQIEQEAARRVEVQQSMTEAAERESAALQEDVEHLLDVVSAVEEGDLTVQANVSERATGLVADTLNRSVEGLGQVMQQVFGTARQVSNGADNMKAIAQTVATNASQQVQSAEQVLQLAEQVERAAQDSAAQVQTTNTELISVSAAVDNGQNAVRGLNTGINTLQQGTDRIVQQMKTLGEFVGLAEQFVQDQSNIASMTQVLALNASLVAARATEQRDPRQFATVAREFESIAEQVSTLAQQTNEGLDVLEQRTGQIHTVVTSVDAEVQNLGGLVEDLTQEADQSSEAFENVRSVTDRAVGSGETIARSSQEIMAAAQSTAQAMRGITDSTQQTEQLTLTTRTRSESMEQLSGQLMERIQFFQLPSASDLQIDEIDGSQNGTADAVDRDNETAIAAEI
ncbi:MAG: methyl-accepting chemotaxis protein [Cyanobacteria bacterium J06642_2]